MRNFYKLIVAGMLLCAVFFVIKNYQAREIMTQGTKIVSLLDTRLSYMKGVAAYKFKNNLEIYVPEREEKIFEANREIAVQNNLPVDPLLNFVNVQMRVSVDVQNRWVAKWEKEGFPEGEKVPDLNTETRPIIKQVTQEITEELKALLHQMGDSEFQSFLKQEMHDKITVEFVTEDNKTALYNALINIKA